MNHPTHETTQHDASVKDPSKAGKADAAKSAESKPVLAEGTGGIKVARFTVNGQVKSLNKPVSGAELHRIAGGAEKLTVNGKAVPDTAEPFELADDAEVKAAY